MNSRINKCNQGTLAEQELQLEGGFVVRDANAWSHVQALFGLYANVNSFKKDVSQLLSSDDGQHTSNTIASLTYRLRTTVADLMAFVLSANSLYDNGSDGLFDPTGAQCLFILRAVGLSSTCVLIRQIHFFPSEFVQFSHAEMFVSKLALCLFLLFKFAIGEDPYRFFDWTITYGDINPLGATQQGILINGQFPGPDIYSQTNDNLIINVHNNLPDPFLISWNGVQQKKDSWQDGVHGTNCPIPPGKNFTYHLHLKDQIGSFFYFPSLALHKAAGGFGAIRILSRPMIPVPFPDPAGDFTVLIGDWYKTNHKKLQARLDRGIRLPPPDGILINGHGPNGASFTVDQGKTYRLRISNVGLESSLNIRIEGHSMTLVEMEGTHTIQNTYETLDVHLGQSLSVLITADQPVRDYYIAVSTPFSRHVLTTTAVLHYSGSNQPVSGLPPERPTNNDYSLLQARTFLTNLSASGPRPNPQGSYHYGSIPVTRTIRLANSAAIVNGKKAICSE
ncbi:Monocopper oxidase-like protein SKU5 [Rhynchospora pubera]|uniref:Monocopper oxidase-like protein SKU5 n=1 Tax=Rhynchospora pubera TaxID=906938 RepID=A0AAV8H7N0_9POAL|nr:Monocopper oxidase-like protein SKU5 [Rhynchospora pubera]